MKIPRGQYPDGSRHIKTQKDRYQRPALALGPRKDRSADNHVTADVVEPAEQESLRLQNTGSSERQAVKGDFNSRDPDHSAQHLEKRLQHRRYVLAGKARDRLHRRCERIFVLLDKAPLLQDLCTISSLFVAENMRVARYQL